jgi:hypothetical protein
MNLQNNEIYNLGTPNAPPSSLMDSTTSPKMKTLEGEGIGARSLAYNTSEVEGCAGTPGWGLGRLTSNYSHGPTKTKQQVG